VKLLLDSHTLIWAVENPAKLSPLAAAAILDPNNERWLSAASIWEIAIKAGQGKLSLSLPYGKWMENAIGDLVLVVLPITIEYANAQSQLPYYHRDPFDRMLIAQSQLENLVMISQDALLDSYGIQRLW